MRSNFVIIVSISFIIIFLNLFPHWYAQKHEPAGQIFSGQASWFDPWDINVYVSAITFGQQHKILLENVYTTGSNRGIFYYPLYTITGYLFPRINSYWLFYLLSALTTIILIATLTFFISKLFLSKLLSFLCILGVSMAGGLGFLIYPTYQSFDASMTSFTLTSAFQRPHEGLAIAAYCSTFLSYYFFIKSRKYGWKIAILVSIALTLFFYPYYILSFGLIFGSSLVFLRQKNIWVNHWKFLVAITVIALLVTGLMSYNLNLNKTFSGVISQQLNGPALLPLSAGYGVIVLIFFYQLLWLRPYSILRWILNIWVVSSVALSFLPLGFSRFYLRGLFIPLVILSVITIMKLATKYFPTQSKSSKFMIVLVSYFFLLIIPTSLSIFWRRLHEVSQHNHWYYLTQDEAAAFAYIKNNIPINSNFLTGYYIGNQLPAHLLERVFFGHLLQTPDANSRQKALSKFYSGLISNQEAKDFLTVAKIKYVYLGTDEKLYATAEAQLHYPFLREIYKNNSVKLFAINNVALHD